MTAPDSVTDLKYYGSVNVDNAGGSEATALLMEAYFGGAITKYGSIYPNYFQLGHIRFQVATSGHIAKNTLQ